MDQQGDDEAARDAALLAELRLASAAREPVPPRVLESARAAYTWRLIDAELAELIADSALEAQPAGVRGGVRGEQMPRLVTFEVAGGTTLELEATPADRALRLVGQVVPPRSGTAEVVHPGGTERAEVDEMGRFFAEGIAGGPMRIRLRLAGSTVEIVTDPLTL